MATNSIPVVFPQQLYPFPQISHEFCGIPTIPIPCRSLSCTAHNVWLLLVLTFTIFCIGWPYCYFRLSATIEITINLSRNAVGKKHTYSFSNLMSVSIKSVCKKHSEGQTLTHILTHYSLSCSRWEIPSWTMCMNGSRAVRSLEFSVKVSRLDDLSVMFQRWCFRRHISSSGTITFFPPYKCNTSLVSRTHNTSK